MKWFYRFLVNHPQTVRIIPSFIKKWFLRSFPIIDYRKIQWRKEAFDKLKNVQILESSKKSNVRLGIFFDEAYYHANYVKACLELGIDFEIIDLFKNDWMESVNKCNCDAFLVWPSVNLTIWKEMFDEKLFIIENELHKLIFPSYKELWMYENKRRVNYWLKAHNIPHPKTWIFYREEEALEFVSTYRNYPLVRKTHLGAASSGVRILRSVKDARKDIRKIFRKGIVPRGFDVRDKQWGYVVLQEYIAHDYEWRIARIGDWFIYRKKIKVGDFASGSGKLVYEKPPIKLLEFVKKMTDLGGFKSVGIDIFETPKGFLVNEIQALFGAKELPVTGETGRFVWDESKGWIFEHGDFYRNAAANLRVEYVVKYLIGEKKHEKK